MDLYRKPILKLVFKEFLCKAEQIEKAQIMHGQYIMGYLKREATNYACSVYYMRTEIGNLICCWHLFTTAITNLK